MVENNEHKSKRYYRFTTIIEDVEICDICVVANCFETVVIGKETLPKHLHLELKCTTKDNGTVYFRDMNVNNESKYKKGMIGKMICHVDVKDEPGTVRSETAITILDFIENNN